MVLRRHQRWQVCRVPKCKAPTRLFYRELQQQRTRDSVLCQLLLPNESNPITVNTRNHGFDGENQRDRGRNGSNSKEQGKTLGRWFVTHCRNHEQDF